jgi:hypothetical protein
MRKPSQELPRKPPRELILEAAAVGEQTWDGLRTLTGLGDDRLGLVLVELFNARKIWARERGGVRVYGLERRGGLAPRFPHPWRRSTDGAGEIGAASREGATR